MKQRSLRAINGSLRWSRPPLADHEVACSNAAPISPAKVRPLSIGGDFLTVLVGFFASFSVHLYGELPIAEILVVMLFPLLTFIHWDRILGGMKAKVFALMALWFLAQIVTDVYRGTERMDWIRGLAAILFFALDLAFLTMLIENSERRRMLFLFAYAIGSLIAGWLFPPEFLSRDPWKFEYGTGTNLLAILVSSFFYRRRRFIIVLLFMIMAIAINLYFDFRSAVLSLIITTVLVIPVVPERFGSLRILPPIGSRSRILVLVILAAGSSLFALGLVSTLNSAGLLGEEAQQKHEEQARVKGGLLIGGRPEILVSSRAVADSPIIGHGSWPKDYKYIEMLSDTMAENGMSTDLEDIEGSLQGLIPTHSHIMGAWVWAGILGAVFWAYIFWLAIRGICAIGIQSNSFAPIYMYLFVGFAWDILFSPFGTSRRLTESVIIILLFDLLKPRETRNSRFVRSSRGKWTRFALRQRVPALHH